MILAPKWKGHKVIISIVSREFLSIKIGVLDRQFEEIHYTLVLRSTTNMFSNFQVVLVIVSEFH